MEEPIRFVRRAIAGFSPLKVDGRRNPLYDSLIRRSECQTCHATCMSDDMFDPLARKSRDAWLNYVDSYIYICKCFIVFQHLRHEWSLDGPDLCLGSRVKLRSAGMITIKHQRSGGWSRLNVYYIYIEVLYLLKPSFWEKKPTSPYMCLILLICGRYLQFLSVPEIFALGAQCFQQYPGGMDSDKECFSIDCDFFDARWIRG